MNTRLPKRWLALLLAVMVALVVAPSAAFAEGLASGSLAAQDAPTWADIDDNTVVFTVKAEQADGSVNAKEFTKAEMEAMSKENTTPAKYAYSSKSGASLTVVTKYVTVDQLLKAADVTFAENDTIIGSSDSFTPNAATPFEGFADRKFFPAYDPGKSTQSADGAESVPAVIAIESGTVTLASGTTAGDSELVQQAISESAYVTTGKNAGLRNFWGKTVDELNGNMGGNSYCGGCTYLTVSTPFKVYTATGNGEKTLVKAYTKAQLSSLAHNAEEPKDAKGFLFNKSGWQVGVTTSYIPVDELLADAGITLEEGMTVQALAADEFASFMSYDQIKNGKYFYPAATSSALSADGQEEVGTVLALNWGTVAATPTAGEAKMAAAADPSKLEQQTRIFTGLRSITDTQTGGNRFATGPVEMTIITQKDVNDLSISGVEASYTYTGSAIEPVVSVKDGDITLTAYDPEKPKKGGDFKVSYESNTAIGEGSIVIEGMNGYTGKKTIKFKIAGIDISKATVTVAKATYTGKLLKPAVTVKLGSSTLKAGTDYEVVYSYNKNASKVARVTVTGIGIYANSISKTFTIAKAANNFTVKAAKTTQKVAYNKKKNVNLAAKNVFKVTKNTSSGKITYQLTSAKNAKGKSAMSKFTVSSAGKVTVKKGTAKGVYTLKVKASSKAMTNYKAASTTVTFKVKVA